LNWFFCFFCLCGFRVSILNCKLLVFIACLSLLLDLVFHEMLNWEFKINGDFLSSFFFGVLLIWALNWVYYPLWYYFPILINRVIGFSESIGDFICDSCMFLIYAFLFFMVKSYMHVLFRCLLQLTNYLWHWNQVCLGFSHSSDLNLNYEFILFEIRPKWFFITIFDV